MNEVLEEDVLTRQALLEERIRGNPDDYDALEELGLILTASGAYERALQTLKIVVDTNRPLVCPEEVWKSLGSCWLQVWLNDVTSKAEETLEKAVHCLKKSSSVHSIDVLWLSARCYECLGNFSGAVQMLSNWTMDFPNAPRLALAMLYVISQMKLIRSGRYTYFTSTTKQQSFDTR